MKIALFTDVHGNKPALEAILDDIKKENINEIICLGDVISLGPDSKECLDIIIDNNITMTLGNHEIIIIKGDGIKDDIHIDEVHHNKWLHNSLKDEKYMRYISNCPLYIEREYNGKKVLFAHFLIQNEKHKYPFYHLSILQNGINEIVEKLPYDYIFIGHEHENFTIANKLFDIGSSGCRSDNITRYTIFNTETFEITTKEILFDRNRLIEDVQKTKYSSCEKYAKWFFDIEV